MSDAVEEEVAAAEERLRLAMLSSDVAALDDLIADDLIFTDHAGNRVGKQDDLNMHRSGSIRCHSIEPSERTVLRLGPELAAVSVRTTISGIFRDAPTTATLRFTRLWRRFETGRWRIIVGHSSAIAQ